MVQVRVHVQYDSAPVWVQHRFGYVNSMGTAPPVCVQHWYWYRVQHQYKFSTGLDTGPVRVQHQVGYGMLLIEREIFIITGQGFNIMGKITLFKGNCLESQGL